jgi:hypothetical protein
MLITIIFASYAAFFIFLYNYTQSYRLQKTLAGPHPPKPVRFLANVLIPFGVPWFFLMTGAAYWGFTRPPEYVRKFQLSQTNDLSIWLLIAIFLGLALSYTVIFQAGSLAGFRDGRYNAIAHFPQFVREGADGTPFEIRGYVRAGHDLSSGGQIFYDGRLFVIITLEDKGDCTFVTARYDTASKG